MKATTTKTTVDSKRGGKRSINTFKRVDNKKKRNEMITSDGNVSRFSCCILASCIVCCDFVKRSNACGILHTHTHTSIRMNASIQRKRCAHSFRFRLFARSHKHTHSHKTGERTRTSDQLLRKCSMTWQRARTLQIMQIDNSK